MGGMFSSSTPRRTTAPAVATGPTAAELEAQRKAKEEEEQLLRNQKGRRSTILTGAQGVLTSSGTTGRKTLLGE